MARHLIKEDRQLSKKHVQRCSTSGIIREMKTTLTIQYLYKPIKMGKVKKANIPRVSEDRQQLIGPTFIASGSENL